MEQRLSMVTLGVSDLARSREFYEQGLGWQSVNPDNKAIAFYQAGALVVGMLPRTEIVQDGNLEDTGSGYGGISLAHNVATPGEVDALLAEAEAAGATILKRAQRTAWGGYSGYFADPDGHPWEVAHNPHWTLTEDGGVVLPVGP
jgi:catechol 2,3-dioxygenase-like lactoylglutathione lyase family enzyme